MLYCVVTTTQCSTQQAPLPRTGGVHGQRPTECTTKRRYSSGSCQHRSEGRRPWSLNGQCVVFAGHLSDRPPLQSGHSIWAPPFRLEIKSPTQKRKKKLKKRLLTFHSTFFFPRCCCEGGYVRGKSFPISSCVGHCAAQR